MSSASASSASSASFGWPAALLSDKNKAAANRGKSLRLNELHDGLFLVDQAFTVEECRAIIATSNDAAAAFLAQRGLGMWTG